ncbi:MAG: hypothetical protein ACI4F7_03075, partial [Acutalibacteraceae bacterium]
KVTGLNLLNQYHTDYAIIFVAQKDWQKQHRSCPRKVRHQKCSFDTLIAGGETDEYAETVERSHPIY